ncbi:hypothetical protein [Blastococcus tunisiensis]|uniref:Uncharacterized protein n=1 Tax=Blastococcus tunisiensis TaxID=1798228 RepID=A0A1I2CL38_9ACTN|nr:hypothetical protein [Blastococcus sp. DSM 46838]SFE69109.1 hypothetical protein SAMN05216574_105112 [Blastococcus sp. DSM 46838]
MDQDDDRPSNRQPGTAEPGWTWPPYGPMESVDGAPFGVEEWAPASTVRRPWVRLGRWTLLYRRSA